MTNISGRDHGVNRLRDLEAANARLLQLRQQLAQSKSHTRQKSTSNNVDRTVFLADSIDQTAPCDDPVDQIVSFADSVDQTSPFDDPVDTTSPFDDPVDPTSPFDDPVDPTSPFDDPVDQTVPFDSVDQTATVATKTGWLSPLCDRLEELHHTLEQPVNDLVRQIPLPEPIPYCESATIRVYPSILAGILKEELATAGRVWLLARYLDKTGQGCITISRLRRALTDKSSPLKIFGWRRLRQVMRKGDGILWQTDTFGRMWLRSNKKVAFKLDLERLTGKTVHLPIKSLIGGIASAKAAFYASFHAGRRSTPISRATLYSITGVSERSQLKYDQLADVTAKMNICLGEAIHYRDVKEAAYEDRHAYFIFHDTKGIAGPKGQKYHARQLPNSYTSSYDAARSSQQKKINQALKADLVTQEALGNSHQANNLFKRCFFLSAKKASKATNFDETLFLFEKKQGQALIWHKLVIGGK